MDQHVPGQINVITEENRTGIPATRDWPPLSTAAWRRLRAVALRAILTSLGREGRLDCVSTSPSEVRETSGESPVPGIGVQVARSMFRRVDRNGPTFLAPPCHRRCGVLSNARMPDSAVSMARRDLLFDNMIPRIVAKVLRARTYIAGARNGTARVLTQRA